jgi:hypothetical protein
VRRANSRRIVGIALLVSAAILVVLAALLLTRTLPIAGDGHLVVGSALALAGAVDALVGVRFLGSVE